MLGACPPSFLCYHQLRGHRLARSHAVVVEKVTCNEPPYLHGLSQSCTACEWPEMNPLPAPRKAVPAHRASLLPGFP